MRTFLTLLRLHWRRHRFSFLIWSLLLLFEEYIEIDQYAKHYDQPHEAELMANFVNANPVTMLIYGPYRLPGGIGQFVNWEPSTYLIIIGPLMLLLTGAKMLRAGEGTVDEALYGAGVTRRMYTASALTFLGLLSLAFATAYGLVLAAMSGGHPDLWGWGIITGSLVMLVIFLAAIGAGTLICQVAPTAHSARGGSLLFLAAAWLLRGFANVKDIPELLWFTPLGWEDLVAPYADDLLYPFAVFFPVTFGLGIVALVLSHLRQYGQGLLPAYDSGRIRRVPGLLRGYWYADAPGRRGWWIGMLIFAGFMGGFAQVLSDMSEQNQAMLRVANSILGKYTDLVTSFINEMMVLMGVVLMIFALGPAVRAAADEVRGRSAFVISTGVSRRRPLLARTALGLANTVLLTLAVGVVMSAFLVYFLADAPTESTYFADGVRAGAALLPGMVAASGIAVAVVGFAPRLAPVVWLVPVYAGFVRLTGFYLELPDWMMKSSPLYWVTGDAGEFDAEHWQAWGIMLAVGAVCAAIGIYRAGARDQAGG